MLFRAPRQCGRLILGSPEGDDETLRNSLVGGGAAARRRGGTAAGGEMTWSWNKRRRAAKQRHMTPSINQHIELSDAAACKHSEN